MIQIIAYAEEYEFINGIIDEDYGVKRAPVVDIYDELTLVTSGDFNWRRKLRVGEFIVFVITFLAMLRFCRSF